MDADLHAARRTGRLWLLLCILVSVAACGAMMLLQHAEQQARQRSTIARNFSTRMQQSATVLAPIALELAKRDPALMSRAIEGTASIARDQLGPFKEIAPAAAVQIDRGLAELEQFAKAGDLDANSISRATAASIRVANLAKDVSDQQRARADQAATLRLYGSMGVLALAVFTVGALVHRDRRRSVAIERAHATELVDAAERDALTGLPTRVRFTRDLATYEEAGTPVEITICDLNDFKEINHRLGHDAGDAVLITVAGDLRTAIGEDAVLYRTGGDQFALIAPPEQQIPERVRATMERDRERSLGAVGAARWPADHARLADVVRLADQRMYGVKRVPVARRATDGAIDAAAGHLEADAA